MGHEHREQPLPRGRGNNVPTRTTAAARRAGLRSGGPPSEPGVQPQRMTIRVPARVGNRGTAVTNPPAADGETQEVAPPYTERTESGPVPDNRDSVGTPTGNQEPEHPEIDQTSEDAREPEHPEANQPPEYTRVAPQIRPTSDPEGSTQPNIVRENPAIIPETSERGVHGNSQPIVREEPQRVQFTLDPEIAEIIRRMAQEQRDLRTEVEGTRRELKTEVDGARRELKAEVEGARKDTFEVRVLVKTHESRLNRVFQRVGNIIDDQWSLRAGIDELKDMYKTNETRERVSQASHTSIKSEPVSPVITPKREPLPGSLLTRMSQETSPKPFVSAVSRGIESLYASEEEGPSRPGPIHEQRRSRETTTERSGVDDRQPNAVATPGEAWIRNRAENRQFGLGTDEVLERWRAASMASRERRASRQPQARGFRQQQEFGTRSGETQRFGEQTQEQRRSVTQPHEAGFGRRPNSLAPSQSERQDSNRGYRPPGGSGSGSSDGSGRDGGEPNRRSRQGSNHTRDRSRSRSQASRRHQGDDRDGRSSRRRRKRSPSYSSSSDSSDDWDSEYTVLDDEGRRRRERRDRRRDPKTEYEQEQLRMIQERIQTMVSRDIQYAATYKGVKDVVTIKYAGQNDNGIFTKWLDHLLMYFQLNRMCGPDNELVRLSAMYNSLEGVAEEWYRDIILHTPKRSWTFEKAVCSLFLTYVFGSAASHAAREFSEVKYSRTEGAREYAQRLKTKARRLARKPDESTMIVRFLAGLPRELSQRLTLREQLDPARHRFTHFSSCSPVFINVRAISTATFTKVELVFTIVFVERTNVNVAPDETSNPLFGARGPLCRA